MLSGLEQALADFLVQHGRSRQLLEYTPYLVAIGSPLAWFINGLIGDCRRALHYRLRRRRLQLVRGATGLEWVRTRF